MQASSEVNEIDITPSATAMTPQLEKTPVVWLDLLPDDVCLRMLSYLPTHRENKKSKTNDEDAVANLHLAEVSDTWRRVVTGKLSGLLRISDIDPAIEKNHISRWQQVLGDHISEVYLPENFKDRQACRLLSMSVITKAHIPAKPRFMRALLQGKSVKELDLYVYGFDKTDMGNGIKLIPQMLKECPLETLRLRCRRCQSGILRPKHCSTLWTMDLLRNGPTTQTLREIHLECPASVLHGRRNIVPFFPKFNELYLHTSCLGRPRHWKCRQERINQETFNIAKTLSERQPVGTFSVRYLDYFATYEGTSLISAYTRRVLLPQDLIQLGDYCPNLVSIDVLLHFGAESYFPSNLTQLHSATIEWFTCYEITDQDYPPMVPGFLAHLMHRNENLQELRLRNVRVDQAELEAVLRTFGSRLRVLHIPIFKQGMSPHSRFLWLMHEILTYCPNLLELEFAIVDYTGVHLVRAVHILRQGDKNNCDYRAFIVELETTTKLLQLRHPTLDTNGLEELIWVLEENFNREEQHQRGSTEVSNMRSIIHTRREAERLRMKKKRNRKRS